MIKDEALKLALDALETSMYPQQKQLQAITAIKKALVQPEQEPVGWAEHGVINWLADRQFNHTSFLYDTPPQRTWVGLTDEELQPIADEYRILFGSWVKDFAHAIEAKLKEKNT